MQTSHSNTSGVSAEPTNPVRSSSNVLIIGGKRNGEHIEWFGNRVAIDGVLHVLHPVWFTNGTHRLYYVLEGMVLMPALYGETVDRIEVME